MGELRVLGQMADVPQAGIPRFVGPNARDDDRSTIRVIPPAESVPDLPFSDTILKYVTRNWSAPVLDAVPRFRYWELGEERKMNRPENICGHQQRAVDFYWSILAGMVEGGICLGIGTSNCSGPATFGTDKYYGSYTPHVGRYGTNYTTPMMEMDADKVFPFFDRQFFGCGANHVIEHMADPLFTLSEMLRVTREGCPVWLVTPDMTFSARGTIDPTHTMEFSADGFWNLLRGHVDLLPPFEVLAFNTLDNAFSFEAVLIRR